MIALPSFLTMCPVLSLLTLLIAVTGLNVDFEISVLYLIHPIRGGVQFFKLLLLLAPNKLDLVSFEGVEMLVQLLYAIVPQKFNVFSLIIYVP